MPSHSQIDRQALSSGITALYTAGDAETAQLRAVHLMSVLRLTPYTMAANLGTGSLVVWALGAGRLPGLWLWWAVLLVISGLGLGNWWRHRQRPPERASPSAMRRATLHAAVLAGAWGLLPVLWFPSASGEQQLFVATLVTGMLGAGTFVLNPLPRAAMVYALLISVGAIASLWQTGHSMYMGVAALLGFYTPMVMIGSLAAWSRSTALWRSQAAALRQERMLALLLQDFEQNAGDALWETGADGHLKHLSPRLAQWLGVGDDEAHELPLLAVIERRSPDGIAELHRALNNGRPFHELALTLLAGGVSRHLLINGKPLFDDRGRPRGWRGVLADVTDKVAGERRLREMAHTDSLTGLANRITLRDGLADLLDRRLPGSLLMVDLDHFKGVNDSLGHSVGDELLKAVSQRLRACVRPQDLVARLGGDEFAVLVAQAAAAGSPGGAADDADATEPAPEAVALAQRLIDTLVQPFEIQDRRLRIGASVGIASWADAQAGVDELLVRADTALYAAKAGGRGRCEVYAAPLGERVRRRAAVEAGLRQAVAQGHLALHWQPKVDVATWRIVGVEALLRWDHPQLGRVEPDEFIGAAEQCGLIDDLGRWALHEACRCAVERLPGLTVSVNVSALQLRDGRFVGLVRDTLRSVHMNPDQLELEITESVFIDDAQGALDQLHALRSLGVRVALDDFGTGYSSLAYLRRFPFDTLKIDRAFVNEVLLRDDARAIVKMIAQLAATLGMRTVCEGVESEAQLAAVFDAGCHEVQGYLVSRPRTIDDFVRWRREWREDAPSLRPRQDDLRARKAVGLAV